jgi:hypothetical protein
LAFSRRGAIDVSVLLGEMVEGKVCMGIKLSLGWKFRYL